MDKLKEECGVFGFYNNDDYNTAEMIYYGLFALQHRGEESCGIAINDNGKIIYHKEMGLISEVFNEILLNHLKGKMGIGHVRYTTNGDRERENAQPLVVKYTKGHMAVVHNGNIFNAGIIRKQFKKQGAIFQTNLDTEVIATMLSYERIKVHSIEYALALINKVLKGAYTLLVMTPTKIVATRDPLGMRPLVVGKRNNSYVVCSETAALTAVGAEYIRDVLPGEIITIDANGLRSIQTEFRQTALCLFEFIYFARPDSTIDGANVYQARFKAGELLAQEYKIDADVVIGVPDSGIASAIGYSSYSKIPYAEGLVKNRYIGRTFIQPSQAMREQGVIMKLAPIKSQIAGKRIIMIDDSIVRGTTSKIIVQILKDAGAKEVHVLVSSPPVKHSCHFGIDTSEESTLIANTNTLDEIRQAINANSLGFLSLEGVLKTPVGSKCDFCKACFDGNYPLDINV